MPDDPTPGGTTTAGHIPVPPPAHGWLATLLLKNPTQAAVLAGFLGLGGVNVASLTTRGEDPAVVEARMKETLAAELAQVKQESEDRALLKTAADCSEKVSKLTSSLDDLGKDLRERDDDKLAFMSEFADYVSRIAGKLIKKDPPPMGPRLTEYVTKGALRGVRGGE